SFGRPTCSHTITWSFSNSLVAPSRGNCGGHFFAGGRADCAAAPRATVAQIPSTPRKRRLRNFIFHLRNTSLHTRQHPASESVGDPNADCYRTGRVFHFAPRCFPLRALNLSTS